MKANFVTFSSGNVTDSKIGQSAETRLYVYVHTHTSTWIN